VITWLLAIARNAAIDARRSRLERPYDPDEVLAIVDSRAGIDEPERLTDAERVRTALRALPVEQARAVLLAGCYGLTAREIAEREQVPLGTAKTRIRRGLIRLRDDFGVSHD
jgi:RNA polymerase sigma factor (sigma-70 family)